MKMLSCGYPEIRRVTRADRKFLSSLLFNFALKSGNEKLISLVPRTSQEDVEGEEKGEGPTDAIEAIKGVLTALLAVVEGDLTTWFMQLVDFDGSVEAFDASMPFDVDVYIVEELLKQKGFKAFFLKVLKAYKKMAG